VTVGSLVTASVALAPVSLPSTAEMTGASLVPWIATVTTESAKAWPSEARIV
jgi:hypothetical protein